jgi:(1->4)-alpha-D-glucan 1-alpha-D-glucosylmutase
MLRAESGLDEPSAGRMCRIDGIACLARRQIPLTGRYDGTGRHFSAFGGRAEGASLRPFEVSPGEEGMMEAYSVGGCVMSAESRPRRGTYRVQISAAFGFDRVVAIVDYLAQLGISHLYASPYLLAGKGSDHGYDVVDHRKVSEERGGDAARRRMNDALKEHGLGQVLDIVPNHMGTDPARNGLWADVLKNGRGSRYGHFFDIDWEPPEPKLRNRVLVPILDGAYGDVLEAGKFSLRREEGTVTLHYETHRLPLAPESLAGPLGQVATRAGSDVLAFYARSLGELGRSGDERERDARVLEAQVARLLDEEPTLAAMFDRMLDEISRDPDRLDELLDRQHYRLAHWRTADQEINYRRFFSIDTLVGLRVEDRAVFDHTHDLVLRWVEQGEVDGLRIDHIDGLRYPEAYLQRLDRKAEGAWLLVEKILASDEALPASWPVAGTTGYDFLNQVGGLFVDPAGEGAMTECYTAFIGESVSYEEVVRQSKRAIIGSNLRSEIDILIALLVEASQRHRRFRDLTRYLLREALCEFIVSLPVYRTYIGDAGGQRPEDAVYIDRALADAAKRRPDLSASLWEFLRNILLLWRGEQESEFTACLQQLTGAVMAKGVEDTAFYRYNRLISLNEVGGDPSRFGVTPEAFHRYCIDLQQHRPETMLTTATHDTKRGEDTRLRISVLSEIPRWWREALKRWSQGNERYRRDGVPDRNMEYLFYQTLVGAWPIEEERLQQYMLKAAHEAKIYTSWKTPDAAYEEALAGFVHDVLQDEGFIADFKAFLAPLIRPARISSLAQTLIKYTAPGVPDLYQGTELWDHSLVDPDNRRPVDYDLRRRMLADLDGFSPEDVLARMDEGLPKLWVIRRALEVRRRYPDLFGVDSSYRPLAATGQKADHVVAFCRGDGAITVVPRLLIGLAVLWEDTVLDLPDGRWANFLTGDEVAGRLRLDDLLRRFPVALLVRR